MHVRTNQDLCIFRESGCASYEKPFLYLLFGKEKALLLDTGAGKTEGARLVDSSLPGPVRVGIEATGSMQWFSNLMEELGIECLVRTSGTDSRRRAPEAET